MSSERLASLQAALEHQRADAIKALIQRSIFSLAVVGFTAWLSLQFITPTRSSDWWFFGGLFLIILAFFALWAFAPCIVVWTKLKKFVLPELVAATSGLDFGWMDNVDVERFREWGIFPYFESAGVTDVLHGSIGDSDFIFSELNLRYRKRSVGSNNRSRTITTFRGLYIQAELPSLANDLLIVETQDRPESKDRKASLRKQTLGQSGFVYLYPQQSATPKIPPGLSDDMRDIKRRFKAQHVGLAFHDSHLIMLIETKANPFEISLKQDFDFHAATKQIERQIDDVIKTLRQLGFDGEVGPPNKSGSAVKCDFAEDTNIRAGAGCLPALLAFCLIYSAVLVLTKHFVLAALVAFAIGIVIAILLKDSKRIDPI